MTFRAPIKQECQRLFNAARYSLQGLHAAWQHEAAFRWEVLLCGVGIPIAFYVGHTAVERVLLVSTLLFVLIVEILNSAIEAIVDRVGIEDHVLSARAKDLGSAAVFLALTLTVVTWIMMLC